MKTALITGASGGIGSAAAEKLGRDGFRVCLHYRSNKAAAEALRDKLRSEGIDAEIFYADLSLESDIKSMFLTVKGFCGGIDVLVNNAGASLIKPFDLISFDEWDGLFAVNTRAAFLCAKEAAGHMVGAKWGRIINISSMWGVCGASCEAAYSASKAALIGFTKALAKELAPSGITVNCIAPGVIDTPMNCSIDEQTMEELIDMTPLGRIGHPDDIAACVSFFASDGASFVTGQTLTADGGLTL